MTARLILSIISTLFEEAAIFVVVRWGLPRLGVQIPLAGLIAVMVLWMVIAVIIYQAGTKALRRKRMIGLPDMVGSQGQIVSPLSPEGLVRIRGELWIAKSAGREMKKGEKVTVVGQESLKLIVQESSATRDSGETH